MKKRCLLILPRNIFPVVYGYAIHKKNVIEILNRHYILSIVIIADKEIRADEKQFYERNSFQFKVITIPKWQYFLNAFLAIFSSFPIQVGYYYFRKVQRIIDELLPEQDIVIGSLIRTMKYFEKVPDGHRIVFDMIDSIGLNYQRSCKRVSSLFWKIIYRIEADRLLKYEKYWVSRAYVTMLFNKEECDYWSFYGNACLMPHGVNSKLLHYNNIDPLYSSFVLFIGKMNYQPNVDAVLWYIYNVHSKIGSKIPFIIVGAYPTKEIITIAKKRNNITVTGFVDDPYLLVNSSAVVVAPMQTGAGIQNKVLESMALGKINIITTLAANPILGGVDGEHFLIADTADEFREKITHVFMYPDRYHKIGVAARDFIAMHYTWQIYEDKYIHEIAPPPPPPLTTDVIYYYASTSKEAA